MQAEIYNIGMLFLKIGQESFQRLGYDKIHMNCEKATIGILLDMSVNILLTCTFVIRASLSKI